MLNFFKDLLTVDMSPESGLDQLFIVSQWMGELERSFNDFEPQEFASFHELTLGYALLGFELFSMGLIISNRTLITKGIRNALAVARNYLNKLDELLYDEEHDDFDNNEIDILN